MKLHFFSRVFSSADFPPFPVDSELHKVRKTQKTSEKCKNSHKKRGKSRHLHCQDNVDAFVRLMNQLNVGEMD